MTDTHTIDPVSNYCTICGLTAEAIAQGRDKPATWQDVDDAFKLGWIEGWNMARGHFRHTRRRKLIQVGMYLQIRSMKKELGIK